MRVHGYGRVSGEAQAEHGTSLEGQDERIRAYCNARGLPDPIIRIEVESGGAEKLEKRVELHALIADARPGDLILVPKVDRWSRDLPWGVSSVRGLVAKGVGWIAIDDNVDAATPDGDRALGFMALFADDERKRIKERTVGTRQRLRKFGFFVEGLPPLGYKIVKRKLVIEPESAEIVRKMFDLCIAGRSLREVSAALTAEYPSVHGLDPTAVMRRLKDRRYLGEMNTVGTRGRKAPRGEWIRAHEAIVDQVTFDRAQAALRDRRMSGRPTTAEARTAKFLCRSLILCSKCGHHLYSWAPDDKRAGYYYCINKCVRARHDKVDALVEAEILGALDRLAPRLAAAPAVPSAPKVDLAAKRARLQGQLSRVLDAIADGIVSGEEAKAKVAKLRSDLAQVAQAPKPAPVSAPPARLGDVRAAWAALGPDDRHAIVKRLAEDIAITSTAVKKWERGAWKLRVTLRSS